MGRSPCCDKARVKRGPWSQEEDAILRSFVQRFGNAGNWIALPQKAGLRRCGKSCRLRWLNYLRPELRHGGFTHEEDDLILFLYGEIGSKWSVIASRLPGRTDNDVKNYWNTKLKKRFLETRRREGTPTPPPPPPPPPASNGDDSAVVAADDAHGRPQEDQTPPPPPTTTTTPSLANLDTAVVVVGDDELLVKSEELYSELMDLIVVEQQSTSTNAGTSTDNKESAFTASASSSETSAAVSSSGNVWPVDVRDTTLLSESISSSIFDAPFGDDGFEIDLAEIYSFQDLLADEFTPANLQELYY